MQFDSCACLDASAGLDHISCGLWRACGLSQAWEIPFCSGGHGTELSPVLQPFLRGASSEAAELGWVVLALSLSWPFPRGGIRQGQPQVGSLLGSGAVGTQLMGVPNSNARKLRLLSVCVWIGNLW